MSNEDLGELEWGPIGRGPVNLTALLCAGMDLALKLAAFIGGVVLVFAVCR